MPDMEKEAWMVCPDITDVRFDTNHETSTLFLAAPDFLGSRTAVDAYSSCWKEPFSSLYKLWKIIGQASYFCVAIASSEWRKFSHERRDHPSLLPSKPVRYLGFITIVASGPEVVEIHNVMRFSDRGKKGAVGPAMMCRTLLELDGLGIKKAHLHVTEGTRAHQLYKDFGFVELPEELQARAT